MVPDNDFDALWMTLDGEAESEPIEGIIGVGSVIRNRVEEIGKSYLEVCLLGVDIYRHQFSCWNQNDPSYKRLMTLDTNRPIVEEIKYVAQGIIGGQILDNTRGSNHYLTTTLLRNNPPSWARLQVILAVLGHQSFLKCA